jgi:hypothetical protein
MRAAAIPEHADRGVNINRQRARLRGIGASRPLLGEADAIEGDL